MRFNRYSRSSYLIKFIIGLLLISGILLVVFKYIPFQRRVSEQYLASLKIPDSRKILNLKDEIIDQVSKYDNFSIQVQNYLFNNTFDSNSGEKIALLTFDDGPSLDNTPRVLEILEEKGVKATFFVLGSNLDKGEAYRDLLRKTKENGHEIANHGYSHNYSYLYPGRKININNLESDMKRSEDLIKSVIGEDEILNAIRLPGGLRSWSGQQETLDYFNSKGYSIIEWNALSEDSSGRNLSKEQLYQNVVNSVGKKNFVVVLMHDFAGKNGRVSAESLPMIIDFLKEKGFTFKTIY